MTSNRNQFQCADRPAILGLDVAKATVTVYDLVSGRSLCLRNDPHELLDVLHAYAGYDLAVCEATGGYEDVLLATLTALAIPAHRADAARVKAFLRSLGTLAKSDPIDARGLARYGHERFDTLPRWTPAHTAHDDLAILVERRRDLVAFRAAEKNRLQAPRAAPIADDIASLIDELSRRIGDLEDRIAQLIDTNLSLANASRAVQTIAGIGPTIAATLLAGMPEIGHISRRQAASLAGLAPHPRDSGTSQGHRTTRGGRRPLRQPLFLAALTATRHNPKLAEAYKRMLDRGKPKRLALIAIARKIVVIANARVRDSSGLNPIIETTN